LERRSVRNIARLTIAAMVLLTGCATIRGLQARDTEELLTAAGFKKQLVDATDTKSLDAGPPYRLVSRTKDGTVQYTYADPDNCRCVYLGGSEEYAEYRRLATARRLDDERRRAADDVWGRNSWGTRVAVRLKLDPSRMIDLVFSVDVLGLLHNGSSALRSDAAGRAPTPILGRLSGSPYVRQAHRFSPIDRQRRVPDASRSAHRGAAPRCGSAGRSTGSGRGPA
jgi:hypothetical protein